MKKYLIAAALVVGVSGAFVSCHEDDISTSTVEQKIQAFEDVFVDAFGRPDPNHSWGFGEPIVIEGDVTRAEVNVNGNLWNSRPELGETEEQDVLDYMDMTLAEMDRLKHKYAKVFPVNLTNYFVTQVHTGDDYYGTAQNPTNKTTLGSSKMNNLHIAMVQSAARPNGSIIGSLPSSGDWEHVNNFNAGTSQDWGGNTMFINSGTWDFAYENSDDSKYHNKWIVVKGSDINAEKYGNYYYVCFDFEGVPNECKSYFEGYYNGQHINGEINGYFETSQDLINAGITSISDYSNNSYNVSDITDFTISRWGQDNMLFRPDTNYSDWIIRLVAAQPKEGAIPKVKVLSSGGGKTKRVIYSGEQVVQSGRVFCEDIVSARYALEDLDYNDVVFDAAIVHNYRKLVSTFYDDDDQLIESTPDNPNPKIEYDFTGIEGQANGCNEYYAKVCLLAAGGTLPIAINIRDNINNIDYINKDVHDILGGSSPTVMINTLKKTEREIVNMAEVTSCRPAVNLTYKNADNETTDKFYGITDIDRDIKLYVQYGNVAAGISSKYYDGQENCVASAKIMVPLGTPWAKERTNIARAYPQFKDWVRKETDENGYIQHPFWEFSAGDDYIYLDNELDGNKPFYKQGLDPDIWGKDLFINTGGKEVITRLPDIVGSSIREVEPENPVIPSPTGTVLYDFTDAAKGPGFLYTGSSVFTDVSSNMKVGSTIRVYGVNIENWEVKCNFNEGTFKSYATAGCGYIDIPVTRQLSLREQPQFSGKNFTIMYVTLLSGAFWEGSQEGNFVISGADLAKNGLTVNSTVRYTGSRGQYYCNYEFHEGQNNSGLDGVTVTATWNTNDFQVTSDGYVDVIFTTQAAVDHVCSYGYTMAFGNFTCKKVEIINP